MKTCGTFIFIIFNLFQACAQVEEEELNLEVPINNPIEQLEHCTKTERPILEEQYDTKSQFEKSKVETQQFLEYLKSENPLTEGVSIENYQKSLKTFGIIADSEREGEITDPLPSTEAVSWDNIEENKHLVIGPSQYDSRIELLELSPLISWQRKILDNSRSVGIIIDRDRLTELTDSLYILDVSTKLKTVFRLCPEEPYREQLSLGVGTAFIIGQDIMMTANHVFEANISNYVILFNFEIINRGGAVFPIVAKHNVFEIEEIISENDELDITQFRVKRDLEAPPLNLATKNNLSKGDDIYMIGHPSGLPKKVALNASVYTNDAPFHFYTTLDAFQGNSGSPVFDLETHTVIGVLVSGSQDFIWTGQCNKSSMCYTPYCKGEKVIRIERILND